MARPFARSSEKSPSSAARSQDRGRWDLFVPSLLILLIWGWLVASCSMR